MERDAGPSARGKGGGPVERREEEAGWATGPRGEGEGKLGPRVSCGLGRAGTGIWAGSLLFSLSFFFLFLFFFKLNSNYLNSNTSLNSNPMHSTKIKPCTSMNAQTILNLEKILIACATKLD